MTSPRRLARTFIRLALPVAVLAVALTGTPAQANRQTNCLYGIYDRYYDEFGELCAMGDTCTGHVPGGCYLDFSFSTWQQDVIVCYCEN